MIQALKSAAKSLIHAALDAVTGGGRDRCVHGRPKTEDCPRCRALRNTPFSVRSISKPQDR